jgi:hypothetical protein
MGRRSTICPFLFITRGVAEIFRFGRSESARILQILPAFSLAQCLLSLAGNEGLKMQKNSSTRTDDRKTLTHNFKPRMPACRGFCKQARLNSVVPYEEIALEVQRRRKTGKMGGIAAMASQKEKPDAQCSRCSKIADIRYVNQKCNAQINGKRCDGIFRSMLHPGDWEKSVASNVRGWVGSTSATELQWVCARANGNGRRCAESVNATLPAAKTVEQAAVE